MTMTMVVAPSPFCAFACASHCCRLAVAETAMVTTTATGMLHVRWWLWWLLPAHVGAQPGRRRAVHACIRVQRWLCGWRAALAGESSGRIVVAAEWSIKVCGEGSSLDSRLSTREAESCGVRVAHGFSRSLMAWTLRSAVRG